MKKARTSKVNYNLYVEEMPDFFQGILTSIVKKETSEIKDNYIFIYDKSYLNKESVYFDIINGFIFDDLKKVKSEHNLTSLNIITPYGEGLELLKSKYKRVNPYDALPLAGNEAPFSQIRTKLQEQRELGMQVQYVVILPHENNSELNWGINRINDPDFLNTHFFDVSTNDKKIEAAKKGSICFKNDNANLDLHFYINKKHDAISPSDSNSYCFCTAIMKKNKYDQNKNHYYTFDIDANSEIEALIKGIRACCTESKSLFSVKTLKSTRVLNIYAEDKYGERILNIFNNILGDGQTVNLNNFIPDLIKKNIQKHIKKNNYRIEKKRDENLIQVDVSVPSPPNTIIVYTDGSILANSELSCFGAVFRMPNSDNIIYEIAGNTTEKDAKSQIDYIENKGIEEALKFLKGKIQSGKISDRFNVEIRSDSFNNIREINKKLNNTSEVENAIWEDKINTVVELSKFFKNGVSFKWVKGHHTDPYNHRADKMASLGYVASHDSIYVFHEDLILENTIKPTLKNNNKKTFRR